MTTISRGTIPTDYFKPFIHMIHPNSNIHIYKNLVEIVVLVHGKMGHNFLTQPEPLFFTRSKNGLTRDLTRVF